MLFSDFCFTLYWPARPPNPIITVYKYVTNHNYWLSVLVASKFHRIQRQKKQRTERRVEHGAEDEENTCLAVLWPTLQFLPLLRFQPASSPAAWPPPWLCGGPSACRTRPTRTAASPPHRRLATSGQGNIETLLPIATVLMCDCGGNRWVCLPSPTGTEIGEYMLGCLNELRHCEPILPGPTTSIPHPLWLRRKSLKS